eukprot:3554882-Rhodomonas_salina.1
MQRTSDRPSSVHAAKEAPNRMLKPLTYTEEASDTRNSTGVPPYTDPAWGSIDIGADVRARTEIDTALKLLSTPLLLTSIVTFPVDPGLYEHNTVESDTHVTSVWTRPTKHDAEGDPMKPVPVTVIIVSDPTYEMVGNVDNTSRRDVNVKEILSRLKSFPLQVTSTLTRPVPRARGDGHRRTVEVRTCAGVSCTLSKRDTSSNSDGMPTNPHWVCNVESNPCPTTRRSLPPSTSPNAGKTAWTCWAR